tara:strand:+ start:338 stop:511 length:174 start_codon:yes stop_codon:yes gene_type:complete
MSIEVFNKNHPDFEEHMLLLSTEAYRRTKAKQGDYLYRQSYLKAKTIVAKIYSGIIF